MKKRPAALFFALLLLSTAVSTASAGGASFPWAAPPPSPSPKAAAESTAPPNAEPEEEATLPGPSPVIQGAIRYPGIYSSGTQNTRGNDYWELVPGSYSGNAKLTLKDGLYIVSDGDCVVPPSGCKVIIEGTVTLISKNGSGLLLIDKQNLTISPGANLIIKAKEYAVQTNRPFSAENCTLDLTSTEHSAINNTQYVYLGVGTTAVIRSKVGYCINSANDITLMGDVTLSGESGGISAPGRLDIDPRANVVIDTVNPASIGVNAGIISASGPLTITSGGDGVRCQGFTSYDTVKIDAAGTALYVSESPDPNGASFLRPDVFLKSGGDALVVQNGDLTVSGAALNIEAGGRGMVLSGGLQLTRAKLNITAGGDSGDLTLKGDVTLDGCELKLPTGFATTGGLAMKDSTISVAAAAGAGVSCGGAVTLSNSHITVQKAGGDGVSGGTATLSSGSTITVGEAGGNGLRFGAFTLESGSVTVDQCGEIGLYSDDNLKVAGPVKIGAAKNGLAAGGGITLSSGADVVVKSDLFGLHAQRGVQTSGDCFLSLDTGGAGIYSAGDITLNFDNDKTSLITAKGNGIQSGGKVTLCQPGHLSIDAGDVGIRAASDVTVGRDAATSCSLDLKSASYSIASERGNVSLRAADGLYNFDGSIYVDTKSGKTYSVMEGAALLFGARDGFGVGIFRKDYTFTPEMTPVRLDIRLLQIGPEHTVRVTSGTKMKIGPLILGKNAFLIVEDQGDVYYNGPTNQVLGEVKLSTTQRMDFIGGSPRDYGDTARWNPSTKTLTLTDAAVDVDGGPALSLPGGSTLVLKGESNLLTSSGSEGPVVECAGDLTIEGGALELRGGDSGVKAAGTLTVNNSKVSSSGSPAVSLSDGGALRGQGAVLASRSAAVPVVRADGAANVSGSFTLTGGSAGIRTGGPLTLSGSVGTDGAPAVALAPGGRLSSGGVQLSAADGEAAVLAEGDAALSGRLTLSGGSVRSGAGTLTLESAALSADKGPAVTVADGGTLTASPEAMLSVSGSGPVIQGEGALTVSGGSFTLTGGENGIWAEGELSAGNTVLAVTGASGPALKADSLTSSRSALVLSGNGSPLLVSKSVTVDSLPGDVQALPSADGEGLVLKKDGVPLRELVVSGDGASDQQFKTDTRKNADGTTTSVVTNLTTGAVTETTALPGGSTKIVTSDPVAGTAKETTLTPDGGSTQVLTAKDGGVTTTETSPDGTYVLNQTRPDGTTLFAQLDQAGEGGLLVTLPEGVERSRVTVPLPAGAPELVPLLYAPDGTETPIPLSDTMDGELVLLAPADSAIRLVPAASDFTDVDASAWYADDVAFISGRELMQGVGENRFAPLEPITCSMLLTALHRLAGSPEAQYTEGSLLLEEAEGDEWYYGALLWGVAEGVVDGVTDGFRPEVQATREQIASMLFHTAPLLGLDDSQRDALNTFTDTDEAGEWAMPALRWTVSQDVLRGRGWGILDPSATATRSEEAALLRRFVRLALAP